MRIFSCAFLVLSVMTSCGSTAVNMAGPTRVGSNSNATRTDMSGPETTANTKETKMSESAIKAVSMTATAENTPAGLIVNYVVENHTDQSVYLWDLMVGYDDDKQKTRPRFRLCLLRRAKDHAAHDQVPQVNALICVVFHYVIND